MVIPGRGREANETTRQNWTRIRDKIRREQREDGSRLARYSVQFHRSGSYPCPWADNNVRAAPFSPPRFRISTRRWKSRVWYRPRRRQILGKLEIRARKAPFDIQIGDTTGRGVIAPRLSMILHFRRTSSGFLWRLRGCCLFLTFFSFY